MRLYILTQINTDTLDQGKARQATSSKSDGMIDLGGMSISFTSKINGSTAMYVIWNGRKVDLICVTHRTQGTDSHTGC